jgi:hypothetical protein
MRVRRFLHFILLLGACGLVWQVWLTWSHSRPPIVTNGPSSLKTQVPTVSQAGPGTGKNLSHTITAKNLFSPDRRTAQEEAPKKEEKPPVPPPKHLKLVGVFLTGGRKEAFFTDASKGGKVVRVAAGATFESYQVTRLTHSEAVLTLGKGGEEVSLRMDIQKSTDAAKAPRIIPTKPKKPARRKGDGAEEGSPEGQAPGKQAPLTYESILGGGSAPVRVLGAATTQAAATTPPPASGNGQDEALSIRQNIRQMQRRLREIRRVRARERRETRAEGRNE